MTRVLEFANDIVWGVPALVLILSVGLFVSIRTGFAQITLFPRALREFCLRLRGDKSTDSGVTPFQALCTALAATVGVGNIAGVAAAIVIGGPGAVFWMWISALFAMILKYAEILLAVAHRRSCGSRFFGGAYYYIKDAFDRCGFWRMGVFFSALFSAANSCTVPKIPFIIIQYKMKTLSVFDFADFLTARIAQCTCDTTM